jgi:hypothetical protein
VPLELQKCFQWYNCVSDDFIASTRLRFCCQCLEEQIAFFCTLLLSTVTLSLQKEVQIQPCGNEAGRDDAIMKYASVCLGWR